jgi:hypothetical protein
MEAIGSAKIMQELLESHNAYNMSTLEMMTPPPKRC